MIRFALRTPLAFPTALQSRSLPLTKRGSRRHRKAAQWRGGQCTTVPLEAAQIEPIRARSQSIYVPWNTRIIFVASKAKDATRCMYAQENDPGNRDDVTGRFDAIHGHSEPDVAESHYDPL